MTVTAPIPGEMQIRAPAGSVFVQDTRTCAHPTTGGCWLLRSRRARAAAGAGARAGERQLEPALLTWGRLSLRAQHGDAQHQRGGPSGGAESLGAVVA